MNKMTNKWVASVSVDDKDLRIAESSVTLKTVLLTVAFKQLIS